MTVDRAFRPVPRRRASFRGASDRLALVGIVLVAVVLAALLFTLFDRQAEHSATQPVLLERGMSPGHRLLNQEAGRVLPGNSPRIARADALVTQVASRFRTSNDEAAALALKTRNTIAQEQPEDVLDVLGAAMFATEAVPREAMPALAPVLAAYAQARLNGANVAQARNVARSFVRLASDARRPR